jgi:multiple sugar transport system permease protein
LNQVGLPGSKWVSDPSTALLSVMLVDIWQWTPFMFLLLLAAFQAVPREPMEAAMIDGASYLKMIRRVALPYMKPVMLVAILIRTMDAFRVFDIVEVLTDGGPGFVTSNLVFQTFLQAFRYFEIGYSMALSWIAALFIIALTTILIYALQKTK